MRFAFACVCFLLTCTLPARAEDWPEWRGKGRRGLWNESGIVDNFPPQGLTVAWRTPIGSGFSGPAVAGGRVFVLDFSRETGTKGTERAVCLDERTGRVLWAQSWPADYRGMQETYATGPRATPTVDGDRVYTLGGSGVLHCLSVSDGAVLWKKDYVRDFTASLPVWGMTSAPLVDGERLICLVGGDGDATVVAFDKKSGREIWRAIHSDSEPGYAQLILVENAGTRQLILWHPRAVYSLDPSSGKILWQEPFRVNMGLTVATPVVSGLRLLVSSFYNGSLMLELERSGPGAKVLWKGKSASEIDSDGLHALIATPVIDGDFVYGVCSYGQFRCIDARSGSRVWETLQVTGEKARWATAMMVRNEDRYFINNDRGELILARLSPDGYTEIGRTFLIKPTTHPGNRRQAGAVHWSHPAYANRRIYARNDEEILAASLAR